MITGATVSVLGRALMALGFLALLAASIVPAAKADEAPKIALVVGNKNYQMTGWQLGNTAADAELVANGLRNVGFDVDLVIDADKAELETAIRLFGRKLSEAGREAVGVFYYAGHGAQADGYNFLIPVDAAPQIEADLFTMAPRLDNLTLQLKAAGNRTNFVILDACRNNPLPASSRSTGGGLAKIESAEARGLLIAYSTAPGKTASDGAAATNSPFAQALSEFLAEPGLSAEQLFKRVAGRVEELTNDAQQPWVESGLRGADFCFAGCAPRVVLTDPADLEFWSGVKDSNDAPLLQSYIDAFPRGRFVPLAQAKLANLSSVTPPGAATGVVSSPSAPSGAEVSDFDRTSALSAVNLGFSGQGGVTFDSSEIDGADQVLRGARLALLDAGGAFDIDTIRVVNPRMVNGEPALDALILSRVSVDAVEDEGSMTVDEVRLDTPNPATLRFVGALFSGDALGRSGFARAISEYGFGRWTVSGFSLRMRAYQNFNLAVSKLTLGGLAEGDLDAFDLYGVVFDGDNGDEVSFSGRLERLAINGFRGRFLDALADLNADDSITRAKATSTLLGAGGISDPYAKRFDDLSIENLNFQMDGVKVTLTDLAASIEDTRDGVIQRASFDRLSVGFDTSGRTGQQALQSLSALGRSEFEFALVSEYSGDPFEDRLFVREFELTMKDGFSLDLAYDVTGLRRFTNLLSQASLQREQYYEALYGGDATRAASVNEAMLAEAQRLEDEANAAFALRRAQATLIDRSAMEQAMLVAASLQGVSVAELREQTVESLRSSLASATEPGAEGVVAPVVNALETFVRTPGRLMVRIKPREPVNSVELEAIGDDLGAAIVKLGVEVDAAPAP